MRWMAIAAVLAAGCGGSEARQAFEGRWTVQVNGASGDMTLAAQGADGIGGTWSVAGLGTGTVVGTVTFGDSIYFAVVDASHQIGADVTATVAGNSMSGVVHGTPQVAFAATRN